MKSRILAYSLVFFLLVVCHYAVLCIYLKQPHPLNRFFVFLKRAPIHNWFGSMEKENCLILAFRKPNSLEENSHRIEVLEQSLISQFYQLMKENQPGYIPLSGADCYKKSKVTIRIINDEMKCTGAITLLQDGNTIFFQIETPLYPIEKHHADFFFLSDSLRSFIRSKLLSKLKDASGIQKESLKELTTIMSNI